MLFTSPIRTEIKSLLKLSIPIAIGELSGVLMNLIDAIMTGHLGTESVAAVSAANAIYVFFAIIGIGATLIIAPKVATAYAQNNFLRCQSLWKGGFVFSFLLALVLILCLFISIWQFDLFRQEAGVSIKAKVYLMYLTPCVLPLLLNLHIKHYADGLNYTNLGMIMSLSALCIDSFLNWLLIFGNWGFPALGLNGAALTNTITQFIVLGGMYLIIKSRPVFKLINSTYTKRKNVIISVVYIFKEAIPVGFQNLIEYSAFGFGAIMIGWVNASQLAAHQIAMNIALSSFMISLAIGAAGAIRVGHAVGTNDTAQMKLSGRVALGVGLVFVIFPCIIFLSIPSYLASYFINEVDVITLAIPLIIVAGIFQISDSLQTISQALLRGLGDYRFPSIITFVCYWIIGLPIGAFLCFKLDWNALGVWVGFLIALVLQAIFFSRRFFKLVKNWME